MDPDRSNSTLNRLGPLVDRLTASGDGDGEPLCSPARQAQRV